MKKVYICSAYSSQGKIEENVQRAKNYSRMAIEKMCLPITPHIYFTQFMSDDVPIERAIALNIGLELIDECDELWIFGTAAGGMDDEIDKAKELHIPIREFTVHGTEIPREQRRYI